MTRSRVQPLTPTSFLERSANVFGGRTAVIDGDLRLTYAELHDRTQRLAGALLGRGLASGDRVAVLAPNSHVTLEVTLGAPVAGLVLVALNIRLSPAELAYIVDHAGARLLIYDSAWADVVAGLLAQSSTRPDTLVAGGPRDEYEPLLAGGPRIGTVPRDEEELLALNYTSGTTGRPKGVMYQHRGAHLQALSMAFHARLAADSVYLWTLPMFHCNGWCFPWAVTAAGATHVCLRQVEPQQVWRMIREHGVSHCCAAPAVLNMLLHHPAPGDSGPVARPIRICTGGSPPSPALLERAADLRIDIQHLYGLTESYGPSVLCEWWPEWQGLSVDEAARRKARQGVGALATGAVRVVDGEGRDVPADGKAMGEIYLRGNNVMLGYYRDPDATAAAFDGEWLKTGDLAVMHPDGYVEVRDRLKDVIISGGENISSVEVEQALSSHPMVLECAVVGAPHERWGEVPVAFVVLHDGARATAEALQDHVRSLLAHFKAPRQVVFVEELPKTATGKTQKHRLRAMHAGA